MIAAPPPLAGRTVALPESRELDQLSRLLEEQGATALRCPLVSILDAPDPAPVDAWLQRLTGVILFTAFFAGGVQLYLADAVSLAIACGAAGLITLAWTLFSR